MSDIYNPWREAGAAGVPVHYVDGLPGGVWGLSDGRQIWLDNKMLAREMRATLAHELVHVEMGHASRCDEATEAEVCRLAAERLVPSRALRWALKQTTDPEELAVLLDVDQPTIEVLLGSRTGRGA